MAELSATPPLVPRLCPRNELNSIPLYWAMPATREVLTMPDAAEAANCTVSEMVSIESLKT